MFYLSFLALRGKPALVKAAPLLRGKSGVFLFCKSSRVILHANNNRPGRAPRNDGAFQQEGAFSYCVAY